VTLKNVGIAPIVTFFKNQNIKSNNTQSINNQPNLAEKAEQFNNFFCTIGEKLASDIPNHQNQLFSTYLKNCIPSSIYLDSPNINEIANCISSLNVNKAVGHDNISAYYCFPRPRSFSTHISRLFVQKRHLSKQLQNF